MQPVSPRKLCLTSPANCESELLQGFLYMHFFNKCRNMWKDENVSHISNSLSLVCPHPCVSWPPSLFVEISENWCCPVASSGLRTRHYFCSDLLKCIFILYSNLCTLVNCTWDVNSLCAGHSGWSIRIFHANLVFWAGLLQYQPRLLS